MIAADGPHATPRETELVVDPTSGLPKDPGCACGSGPSGALGWWVPLPALTVWRRRP